MKKKIIISVVAIILFITVAAITYFVDQANKPSKVSMAKTTENIIESFLNTTATEKELVKLTGIETVKPIIMLGKDSDLQAKPSSKLIEKYKLENYEKAHKKYITQIETSVVENTKYKIKNSTVDPKGVSIQTVELTGFYYAMFFTDWIEFSIRILDKTDADFKKLETDEPTQAAFYQAKVKALELIKDSLKNYENGKETVSITVVCQDGKPKDTNEINNLLLKLRGMSYKDMDFMKNENVDGYKNRVTKYYNDAVKAKNLDEKNPLKLK